MGNKVSFTFLATNAYSRITKQVVKSTAAVRKNFKGLGKSVEEQNRKIGKSTGFLTGKFKQLAIAAGGFFGAREFLRQGTKFQDAIADLSAITGAAGKDLDFLTEESLRLAKASATAQAEVAGAFKVVASAKSELLKDPKGLSRVTEQVLLLKNATGLDLAQAAKVVTESLNQFGAGADQANRFVNVLAAGSKIGASEVSETGVAVVKAGVAAKLAGVGFEELNALIQVLAKNGVKAEVAGTGLKTALLKLETAGIKKIQPSIVGITTALENLNAMNLDAADLQKLFGLEAIAIGGILTENAALVREWTGAISGTNIAQQQADARMATFSTKIRKLGITMNDVLIRTFLRLEPLINKQLTALTSFLDGLDTANINAFADSLKGVFHVLSIIGDAAKFALSLFKGIGTAIGEFAGQIATLNFGADVATSFTDAFSVGGKLFGLIGGGPKMGAEELTAGQASRTDINMNIRAPEGAIESVKSTTTGQVSGLNVGLNMAEQL